MLNRPSTPQDELSESLRTGRLVARYISGYITSPRSRVITVACLVLVGLGLVLGGFLVQRASQRFITNAATAEGEVVSTTQRQLSNTQGPPRYINDPVVRFRTAAGREVTVAITRSSQVDSYSLGRRVRILYDPAQPTNARIAGDADSWMLPLMLIFTGVAVLIGTGGLVRLVMLDRAEQTRLSRTGHRIQAKIVSIRTTEMASGPPVWSVEAEWTDPGTGQVMVFRSKEVNADPVALNGTVTVVLDPADPRQYHMESSVIRIH